MGENAEANLNGTMLFDFDAVVVFLDFILFSHSHSHIILFIHVVQHFWLYERLSTAINQVLYELVWLVFSHILSAGCNQKNCSLPAMAYKPRKLFSFDYPWPFNFDPRSIM